MDTESYIFLIFINLLTGLLFDKISSELLVNGVFNLKIPIFSILSVAIISFLFYINVELLYFLNVFLNTALCVPLLFIVSLSHLENYLIDYGMSTLTTFIINNFKSIFVKKCKEGSLFDTQIIVVANNMIKHYTGIDVLCNHCFQTAILESSINNNIDVLELLLKNYKLEDNLELTKKIITHVSRLGHYNIFKLLIEKTNMRILDTEFYETYELQIKMIDALKIVKDDYNKAVSMLDIKSIHKECTENCMICHDTHDNILELGCGHYVCLESMCSFYQQNLSEEMTCFVCREKINFRKITSIHIVQKN